jgi:hypothetical protein
MATALVVGCADGKSSAPPATQTTHRTTQEPKMTTTDPRDPKAWEQAAALAEKTAGAPVTKHSDKLPFLFTAGSTKVLIHQGAVVTGRGPAVAGAYLRDLGVIAARGPQIDDVLVVLDALDALPSIQGIDKHAFVDKSLPALAPSIYGDGQTAQIVLHYFVGGKPVTPVKNDPADKEQASGGERIEPRGSAPVPRATARMTLEIPKQGDATWKREDINT